MVSTANVSDVYRLYTAWGFGASVSGGAVSHCYPLNGNLENPTVHGVGGIITAYQDLLRNSTLRGPTNFAPVINRTMQVAKESVRTCRKYACLLILTDGAITDLQQTISYALGQNACPSS
jgi:copine 5/8/9